MEKECIVCNNIFETGRNKKKLTCSKMCLKIHMENIKDDRIRKSKEGMMKKHGVDHPSKIKGIINKVKKIKKERYGDENYNNRNKAKETLEKEYGVDNPSKIKGNINKVKKTKKGRYGDENYNNRKKAKNTIKKEYGVEHHLQLKEILDKQIKTNKINNKVDYNILTKKSRENLIKTNNKNFGSDYYFSSLEYLKETKDEKIKRLKKILEERSLLVSENFEDSYDKLREINGGKLKYKKYEVECKKCKNKFNLRVVREALVCRKCYPIKSGSIIQKEMKFFLKSIIGDRFVENDRNIINPHELDFYIKDKKIAIELNGNYYHSEIGGDKDKKYHISKTERCERSGVKLIHIFEDEWVLKGDIVKSRLKNIIGNVDNKIYARNCEIKEITSEQKSFFIKNNHIQGNCVDKIRIGLFYKKELVSVITFGKPRLALGVRGNKKKETDCYELIRFCSKLNTSVVGGFSKLLKYFVKTYNPKKILTYADCRWSGINYENIVYSKNEFDFVKRTVPSYYYVKTNNYMERKHRFSLNKRKLLELYNGDKNKTGFELALENGYDRIWDCGSMLFEINY